ncbi:MAG TPA: hypothetical protein VFH10_01500 [Nocardioides sp.]|uniref:hypothetical protein n=1 Tax=Nocardioides sp. TaxID=35761 RepID=UPI002D805103|nr:hypothetical protein [Nocardioides sp.]HET6651287.1 hypothetical protein [Nocardioides sp.]
MTSTATPASAGVRAGHGPAGAFTSIVTAAVGGAATKLEHEIAGWTHKLHAVAGRGGGAMETAGAEGVKATLHGRNPVRAAIKGAWQAGTPVVRAAIIAAVASVILLLALSPVLLLIFLVSLLILAAVHRARASKP